MIYDRNGKFHSLSILNYYKHMLINNERVIKLDIDRACISSLRFSGLGVWFLARQIETYLVYNAIHTLMLK